MSKSGKGSVFERWLSVRLSQWWSGDDDVTDLFWRTSGSGARAKVRGRKGKTTRNHSGDLCATDPIGQPLIDLLTIEAKRGYPKATIADLLDKSPTAAQQQFEEWIEQAEESREQAGAYYWLIIHKRDRREAMVYFKEEYVRKFHSAATTHFEPTVRIYVEINGCREMIFGTTLDCFLKEVTPERIRNLLAELKGIRDGKSKTRS